MLFQQFSPTRNQQFHAKAVRRFYAHQLEEKLDLPRAAVSDVNSIKMFDYPNLKVCFIINKLL